MSNQQQASRVDSSDTVTPALPAAALSVVVSALDLVKAEARLAVVEAKKITRRSLAAVLLTVTALALIPAAVTVLALGLLLTPSPLTVTSLGLMLFPTGLLLGCVIAVYVALRKGKFDHVS